MRTGEIRPGVAAVIRDEEGRVLLHRRPLGGLWAPPSGKIRFGEDLLTALHRELAEETGLTVAVERLVGIYSDPAYQIVDDPRGRRVHYVTALFACRLVGGSLQGSEEGLEWDWFLPLGLPEDLTPYAAVWLRDALADAPGLHLR